MTSDDIRKLANLYKSPRASAAEQLTHEALDALADVYEAADNLDLTLHTILVEPCPCRLCKALARVAAIQL